ncbi:MAG TPA: FHA domain-containing protein [Myxococcaceae bacterium]|nr:FHA domain-containing protein [Myxococcaceae bacterium]
MSGPGTGEVGYALKFISGKYQGGEFPLKPNKQVVIGRSSELDMVLVEDMVSRKHAKIAVQGGKISIEDLGSTNGTFVNGEKVRTARLKEGDRILIGTSILKLVVAGAESSQLSDAAVKHNLEAVAQAQAAKTKTSSMSGKIEDIPLPDLLQLFHTSKKNGVLVVKGAHEGRIYLRQGRVYYAVIDGRHELGPQKSFNRIITWEDGDFELRAAESEEFMVELDQSTEALLMDALRLMDEYKRIARDLPAAEASLELCRPLGKPLRELTPRELDVLQLVYNHSSLQEMCDHSLIDDVEIAQAVLDLLRKDYIRGS